MADETCGGAGCTCAAREDGFCSDYCANHAGDEDAVCHCGHAGCEADPATASA